MRTIHRLVCHSALLLSLTLPSAKAADNYAITDLGAVLGASSYAHGINNHGQVVGYWSTRTNGYHAFLYSLGAITDLGTLGGTNRYALSINAAGEVVGFAEGINGIQAFLFRDGLMANLGSMGGQNSYAFGINNFSQIVGYIDTPEGARAVLYSGGAAVILGTLGGTNSYAFGINSASQIAGASLLEGNIFSRAFLWQGGGMVDLNRLVRQPPGWELQEARGINDVGAIVGWGSHRGQERAFFYQDGFVTDLGALAAATNSFAHGVNNSNEVVGACSLTSGDLRAFLWQEGVLLDLNDLLPAGLGWELREARGINDFGQIVGWGTINGEEHAFLLTPLRPPVTPLGFQAQQAEPVQAFATVSAASSPSGPVTNAPLADAHVRGGTNVTVNYGATNVMELQTATSTNNNRDVYFKFDIGNGPLPMGSAKLRVYASLSQNGSVTGTVYSVASTSWLETNPGGITWSTRPPLSNALTSKTFTGTSGLYYEFDVTSFVRAEQAAGRTTMTLALHSPTLSTPYVKINSRENAANKPQLILNTNALPSVTIQSPTNNASFAAPTNISITATASDPDGTITTMAFFAGNLLLGTSLNNPATLIWSNALLGTHALTVRATDNLGGVRTSAVVTITVTTHLAAIADAHGRDGVSAVTNFGTLTNLEVQTSSTVGNNRDAYFKFDISPFTNIVNARLRISARLTAKATVATTSYAVADTNWGEASLTWNNKPARGVALGSASIVQNNLTTNGWYLLDVTSHVLTEKAAGRNLISLALHNSANSTATILINSRENATNRPGLVLTVTNAPPTISITSPINNSTLSLGDNTISVAAADYDGPIARVDFYANSVYLGTDTIAPYAFLWSNVIPGSYALRAVATDHLGLTATSTIVNVALRELNQPPVAGTDAVSTPEDVSYVIANSVLTANDSPGPAHENWQTLTVTAVSNLSVAGGTVTLNGGNVTYTPPLNFFGIDTFQYTVMDNGRTDGAPDPKSAQGTITVTVSSVNDLPNVALTSPLNGTYLIYSPGTSIGLAATASDVDGIVTKVDFYTGGALLGTDSTAPYSLTWNNPPAGVHTLTAVATDNHGATASSAPVFITNNALPLVTVDAPTSQNDLVGWGRNDAGQINVPAGVMDAIAVAGGNSHSLALRSNGTVIAWGNNAQGQINIPATATNVVAIAAVADHSLALRNNGTVAGWGANTSGQLTLPAGTSNLVAIATAPTFSMGLRNNGTVVTWGATNNYTYSVAAPAGLSNVVAIAAGDQHALAVKSDGTVVCWGNAANGRTTPPAGLSNVVAVVGGSSYSLALKQNGTLVGWGDNSFGQLNFPAGLSDVRQIVAGYAHNVALKSNGVAVGWGYTWANQGTPPSGISNLVAIATASSHSLGIRRACALFPSSPTNITILASASDPGGSIVRVDFYANGALLQSDSSAPYQISWNNVAAGNYSLTARAIDNHDGASTSAPVCITVNASPNQPPVAVADAATTPEDTPLTIPTSTLTANDSVGAGDTGQTLTVTAVTSPSSAGGTVILGSGNVTYTPALNFFGTDTFTYTVTDNGTTGGQPDPKSAQATVIVTVTPVNDLPVVALVAPASNVVFAAGGGIAVEAAAADADGQIVRVDFFDGANLVGQAIQGEPFRCLCTNVAAGLHVLAAVGVDNQGGQAASPPLQVMVVPPSFVRGINLNGPAVVVNQNLWSSYPEALSPAVGLQVVGTVQGRTHALPPQGPPDPGTTTMLQSGICAVPDLPPPDQQAGITVTLGDNRSGSFVTPPTYFVHRFANVPSGFLISNDTPQFDYVGWCVDYFHPIEAGIVYPRPSPPFEDPALKLENTFYPPIDPFDKINWLLNNRPAGTSSKDVQNVIWTLIGDPIDGLPTPAYQTMLANANSFGSGFFPRPGQMGAVLVDLGEQLQRTIFQMPSPTGFRLTLPVPASGVYQVYVWVMESEADHARAMNLEVQGMPVANGIGDLALGQWQRYGPYRADILSGLLVLDVLRGTKGYPCLMGLEVHQDIGNTPPVVTITQPTEGARFQTEQSITINASAHDMDPGGSVRKVEFYVNGVIKIGEDTVPDAPDIFSIVWSTENPGDYTLTAIAIDDKGGVARSPEVHIGVGNLPPTLGNIPEVSTYTENMSPVRIAPNAEVMDIDSMNFDNGSLTVGYTVRSGGQVNGYPEDRILIHSEGGGPGKIGLLGPYITFGPVVATFSGGIGTDPLVIQFNEFATLAAVQAIIRNLTYYNVSDNPIRRTRIALLILTDGDGGMAGTKSMISVLPVNDAPQLFVQRLLPTPQLLTTLPVAGARSVVATPDNTKVIVAGTAGLSVVQIVDLIAIPPILQVLGIAPVAGDPIAVSPDGTKVYVRSPVGAVTIVDISNPAAPVAIGSLPVGYARQVLLSRDGTKAFVDDETFGCRIFDVGVPEAPPQIGAIPVNQDGYFADMDLTPDGNTLLLLRAYGLDLYDVSEPQFPVWTGNYVVSDWFTPDFQSLAISRDGNYAYIAEANLAYQIRVLNLGNLEVASIFDYPVSGRLQVSPDGQRLYAFQDWGTLDVFDVSNPASLARLGGLGGSWLAFAPDESVGYAMGPGNVALWDLSTYKLKGPRGAIFSVDFLFDDAETPVDVLDVFADSPYPALSAEIVRSGGQGTLTITHSGVSPVNGPVTLYVGDQEPAYVMRRFNVQANDPPTVTIVRPTQGEILSGNSMTIDAQASDSDGTVTTVDFYRNGTLIGTDSLQRQPRSIVWNNVSPGVYTLTAVATDNFGEKSISAPITVCVKSVGPKLIDVGDDRIAVKPLPQAGASPGLQVVSSAVPGPIGIDHHEHSGKVVISVNIGSGLPYNFELVAADGSRTQFPLPGQGPVVSGMGDEVKIATVRGPIGTFNQGGFAAGTLFCGNGNPGEIARIAPDGTTAEIRNPPWTTLEGETGVLRGSLHVDRTGVFGGNLIVATTAGNVWMVDRFGNGSLLASFPNTHLEGVTTVPNDPDKYGPWAGKILVGAEEAAAPDGAEPLGLIYAIGLGEEEIVIDTYDLDIRPEDFDIIPGNENFYVVLYSPLGGTILGAPASAFQGMAGDILITSEKQGVLWRVHWNGTQFQKSSILSPPPAGEWEHATFSPAGIGPLCETPHLTLSATLSSEPVCQGGGLQWSKVSGPGLVTFSNPNNPTTIASFITPGQYTLRLARIGCPCNVFDEVNVTVQDNTPPQLSLYNLSVEPAVLSTVPLDNPYYVTMSPDETRAYVSANGLKIVDLSTPTPGVYTFPISEPGRVAVSPDGSKVYVGNWEGMRILDVSVPSQPVQLCPPTAIPEFNNGGFFAAALSRDGSTLYGAATHGLHIYRVTDPQNPVLLGFVPTDHALSHVVLSPDGSIAYVVAYDEGLRAINIADPQNAFLYEVASIGPWIGNIAVSADGTKLYAALGFYGFYVVPLDPNFIFDEPTLLRSSEGAWDIRVSRDGKKIYGWDWNEGLEIIDVSDPNNTHLIGSLPVDQVGWGNLALSRDETKIYAANYPLGPFDIAKIGLSIIDIGTYVLRLPQDNAKQPIPLHISDLETPASELSLGKDSANASLIPLENIVFGGSGENRTVTITPAPTQLGTTTVTLRVTDKHCATTSKRIVVTVEQNLAVAMTSPSDGQFFPDSPAEIDLRATVTAVASTVTKVEFFEIIPQGQTTFMKSLGLGTRDQNNQALWTLNWRPVLPGTHQLKAKATDNTGRTAESQIVTITVNAPPHVAISNPKDGQKFVGNPASLIVITATANDPDGSIAQVEFLEGPNLASSRSLGVDTTAPYSYNWPTVAPGEYRLIARATDNQGASAISSPVSIIVEAPRPFSSRLYTFTEDFAEGTLVNVTTDIPDQVQLPAARSRINVIWVANSGKGTVMKINTETGVVMGEYRTAPEGQPVDPSRTTVDYRGGVWTANRAGNSVVHIGLAENGDWVDRNGNGVMDTSTGLGDVRPWLDPCGADKNGGASMAQDECILHYTKTTSTGTRHVSVNADNDVWVSGTGGRQFDLIDGVTGQIKRSEPSVGYGGYGGLIDRNGVIWSARPMLRWDTRLPLTGPEGGNWRGYDHDSYGLTIDSQGNVWNTSYGDGKIRKFAPTGTLIGTPFAQGSAYAQGCVADKNDHIWVAHSLSGGTVGHLLNDGTYIGTIDVSSPNGTGPTGVAVDAAGKIWAANYYGNIVRIDPNAGPIGSDGHTRVGAVDYVSPNYGGILYNYSDMTGSSLPGFGNHQGTWTVDFDSGIAGAQWGQVIWAADISGDSALVVTAATSSDGTTFGAPVPVQQGVDLPVQNGRHIRVAVSFRRASNGDSPVLYSLLVGTHGLNAPIPLDAPPRVDAGEDQTIPFSRIARLNGRVTDDGAGTSSLSFGWTQLSGPAAAVFDSTTALNPRVTFPDAGVYVFHLTASDGGSPVADDVTLTVIRNRMPSVNAGPDQILATPSETRLNGSVSDDGMPADIRLVYFWEQTTGPVEAVFSSKCELAPTVTFSSQGQYVFRLTANDSEFTVSDEVTVTVGEVYSLTLTPANAGPNLRNTTQGLQAVLTKSAGTPVAGQIVHFTVTGPNSTSGMAETGPDGVATFTYTGATGGQDSVTASADIDGAQVFSGTSSITWDTRPLVLCGQTFDDFTLGFQAEYVFQATAGEGITIQLNVEVSHQQRLIVRKLDGTWIAGSPGSHNPEVLDLTIPETGGYVLQIDGDEFQLFSYTLAFLCAGNPRIAVFADSTEIAHGGTFDMGVTPQGTPRTLPLTIKNCGPGRVMLMSPIPITGPFSIVGNPPTTIEVLQSVTIDIAFNAVAAGLQSGTLRLANNGPGAVFELNLKARAEVPNSPPDVQIVSPAPNTVFPVAPANVTVRADASDANGVSRVQFFGDGAASPFGTATVSPYEAVWVGVPAGTHTITAKAFDAGNLSRVSAPVSIVVGVPTLTLSPPPCPDIVGRPYGVTATLRNAAGSPIAGQNIQLAITGANPTLQNALTAPNGTVAFSYVATHKGLDHIVASTVFGNGTLQSDEALKNWAKPVPCGLYSARLDTTDGYSQGCDCNGPGHYADYYAFSGQAGERVIIRMQSTAFDTLLYLRQATTPCVVIASNDDAEGSDSIIDLTLPATGEYIVEATSFPVWATGDYSLEIQCGVTEARPEIRVVVDGASVPNYGSINFGITTIGSTVAKTVVIANDGSATLRILDLRHTDRFPIDNPGPLRTIPAHSQTTMTVRFDPGQSAGNFVGAVEFANNDEDNGDGVETPFHLTLTGTANQPGNPPQVTITAPASEATFVAPATIVATVTVDLPGGGSVQQVELFATTSAGTVKIGRDTTAPYSFPWLRVRPGAYILTAEATDGSGHKGVSGPVNILVTGENNEPPMANNDQPTVFANSRNNVFDVLANDTDPEGNPLHVVNIRVPAQNGTATIINSGLAIKYTPHQGIYGQDGFQYVVSDGHGNTETAWVIIAIDIGESPAVQLFSPTDSDPPYPAGGTIDLIALVEAIRAVEKVEFLVDGEKIAEVRSGIDDFYEYHWMGALVGDHEVTAVATDSAGLLGATEPVRIHVNQAAGDLAPIAVIANVNPQPSPRPPEVLTPIIREGLFNLNGTAKDPPTDPATPDAVAYRIQVFSVDGTLVRDMTPEPKDAKGFHVGAVDNAKLATLDFTQIRNGTYDLVLTVQADYRRAVDTQRFVLESDLKLGQFTLSQQDLVIPVNGLPLTITRTYDSANLTKGDFGYSWTFAINDVDLELNEVRTEAFDFETDEPFSMRVGGSRDVTLTLPGGLRTTFFAYLEPGPSDDGVDCMCYKAKWSAPLGVTATLEATGDNTLYVLPAPFEPFWQAAGTETPLENFDFPGFVLTLQDGTKFLIEREPLDGHFVEIESGDFIFATAFGKGKVTQIIQPSGDTVHILTNPDRIEHRTASGQTTRTVEIQRENGLITQITDPAGTAGGVPAVKYEYDADGNLTTVRRLKDAASEIYEDATFLYEILEFPHYLTKIIDARGVPVARQEFYSQALGSSAAEHGRLKSITAADGRTTTFTYAFSGLTHPSATARQSVVDNESNTTIHETDSRGNIVLTVDALENSIERTFDSRNNMTVERRVDSAGVQELVTTLDLRYASDTSSRLSRLLTVSPPNGLQAIRSVQEFDLNGRLTKTIDSKHTTITDADQTPIPDFWQEFEYDPASGQPIRTKARWRTTPPDRSSDVLILTENTYFPDGHAFKGLVRETIDALGHRTSYAYYDGVEAGGRLGDLKELTQEKRLGDGTFVALTKTAYRYDANGNRTHEIRKDNSTGPWLDYSTTVSIFDAQNRVTEAIDAEGGHSYTTYDANGRTVSSTDRYGAITRFAYNALGELIQTEYPDGALSRTAVYYESVPDLSPRALRHVVLEDRHLAGESVNGTRTIQDELGRPVRTERVKGIVIDLVPDGSVLKTIFRSAAVISATQTRYDFAGRVTLTADANGKWTKYDYDGAGRRWRLKAFVDANGNDTADTITTLFGYDENGNQLWMLDANQHEDLRLSEPGALLGSAWDVHVALYGYPTPSARRPRLAYYEYDKFNRRVQAYSPSYGTTASFATSKFDDEGRRWLEVDPDGKATAYAYDALGRLSWVVSDVNSALAVLPAGLPSTWSYPGDRLPDSTVTGYEYDALSRPTAQTDGNQHTTRFQYDRLDRRIRRTLPDGISFETATHDFGSPVSGPKLNRVRQRDFAGRFTLSTSDLLGRTVSRQPDGQDPGITPLPDDAKRGVMFSYTATGQRETMTDGSGLNERVTRYVYDENDRLRIMSTPEGTVTYEYDPAGNATLISARQTYTFPAAPYRLPQIEARATLGNPNGALMAYRYDGRNRLWRVNADNATPASPADATYTYDYSGNLKSVTYRNLVRTDYAYNSRNQLAEMAATRSSSPRAAFKYDDAAWPAPRRLASSGQRRRLQEMVNGVSRTVDYDYDNLHRLTAENIAVGPNTGAITYDSTPGYADNDGYDPAGNRRRRTVSLTTSIPGFKTVSYATYDANDRLGSAGASQVRASFDANGNTERFDLNADGAWDAGNPDRYDFENRLIAATRAAGAVTVMYDGDGNRVRKTVAGTSKYYLVDDRNPTGYAQVLEERASLAGDPVVKYLCGLDLISQSILNPQPSTRYYGYDGLGSVRYLTDTGGNVTDTYTYDAFGNQIDSTELTPNHYRFTGEQWDADLGTYYLRARYYHADLGRFWTMDTYEGSQSEPLSLHKYLYAHDNPVNGIDPSGNGLTLIEQLKVTAIQLSLFTARWAARYPKTTFVLLSALSATGIFDGFPPGHPTPFDELAAWGKTLRGAGQLTAEAASYARYQGALLTRTFFSKYWRSDYAEVFYRAFDKLRGKVWVHHAVPQAALKKYPGVIKEAELHSLANLRGIPLEVNGDIHLSQINGLWKDFYKTHQKATRQQLLDFAKEIDDKFGHLFNPPIRPAPGASAAASVLD